MSFKSNVILGLVATSLILITNSFAVDAQSFWWDGESFYWDNTINNCSSRSIKFLKSDGSNRLTKNIAENEYQYCPYFTDWNSSSLYCDNVVLGTIYPHTTKITKCFDSDGGLNYNQFGSVKDAENLNYDYIIYDRCDGDVVLERYCNGDSQWTRTHLCTDGCSHGACDETDRSDPWSEIWVVDDTVHYTAISRSSGGLAHMRFLQENGCEYLARTASVSGGSYTANFDWHSVVIQQYVSDRGYIDVSKTIFKRDYSVDFELRRAGYWADFNPQEHDPYLFGAEVCVHGNYSTNDLEEFVYGLEDGIPWKYTIINDDGSRIEHSEYQAMGGYIQEMKDGECSVLALNIQPQHHSDLDNAQRVMFELDHDNIVMETNENNNNKEVLIGIHVPVGFTTLGAPVDWDLDEYGNFRILLNNRLASTITIHEITVATDGASDTWNTYNCQGDNWYLQIGPGETIDPSNECPGTYMLNLGPQTQGDGYSVEVSILYNAGGFNHTETGMVFGTVSYGTPVCTDGDSRSCGQCREGTRTCYNGVWGSCIGDRIPTIEICDGIDNDCDGQIDEGDTCIGGSCGDGFCGFTNIEICSGETTNIIQYGEEYEVSLIGVDVDLSRVTIQVNGVTRTLDVNRSRIISGLDTYILDTWKNDISVAVAIGTRPVFSIVYDIDGSYEILVSGGIPLSSEFLHYDYAISDKLNTVELDSTDLPDILGTGIFEDSDGDLYQYDQSIEMGTRSIKYGNSQNDDTIPEDKNIAYWQIGTNPLTPFYTLKIHFDEEINFSNPDVGSNHIELFGKEYTISSDSDEDTLILFGGANTQTLTEGETTTIDVDGVSYDVFLIGVSDSNTIIVQVDGVSRSIYEGNSRIINGLEVYVDEVYYLSKEGQLSSARLSFDSSRLVINDNDEVSVGSGSYAEDIDNTLVTFTQGSSGTQSIEIAVAAPDSDGDYVAQDRPFTDTVFGSFQFALSDSTDYDSWKDIECWVEGLGDGGIFVFGETRMNCLTDCQYEVECYQDEDCGESTSSRYCSGDSVCTSFISNVCNNPGTRDSYCIGAGGGGCSSPCPYGCEDGYCIEAREVRYLAMEVDEDYYKVLVGGYNIHFYIDGVEVTPVITEGSGGGATDTWYYLERINGDELKITSEEETYTYIPKIIDISSYKREICYNGIDDDSDGIIDDGCTEIIYLYISAYPNIYEQGEIVSLDGFITEWDVSSEVIEFIENAVIELRMHRPDGEIDIIDVQKECEVVQYEGSYYTDNILECDITSSYSDTDLVGDYVIEAVPNDYVINYPPYDAEEDISYPKIYVSNVTFRVFDKGKVEGMLILEDIDGYEYLDHRVAFSYSGYGEQHLTAYFAIYDKDGNKTVLVYEFDSEEYCTEFLDTLIDIRDSYYTYNVIEREINGMTIYEMISTVSSYDYEEQQTEYVNSSIYIWKKDNVFVAVAPYAMYYSSTGDYEEPTGLIEAYLDKHPSDINVYCGNDICDGEESFDDCPQDCGDCKLGDTRRCGQTDVGACNYGFEYCINYTWSDCLNETKPTPEICGNGIDENCNGFIDDECFDNKVSVSVWLANPVVTQGEKLLASASVSDWNGNRLENASLTLTITPGESKYYGTTDENGMWTHILRIGNVDPGEYTVKVKAEYQDYDYGEDEKTFTVSPGLVTVDLNDEITLTSLGHVVIKMEAIMISLGEIKRTVGLIINYYSVHNQSQVPLWEDIESDTDDLITDVSELQEMIRDFVAEPSNRKLIDIKDDMNDISSSIKRLVNKILDVI